MHPFKEFRIPFTDCTGPSYAGGVQALNHFIVVLATIVVLTPPVGHIFLALPTQARHPACVNA
jgi:hypothetical protein